MPENLTYCMDCLEAMREMPDKAFDLAVVDPPYGSEGGGLEATLRRALHPVQGAARTGGTWAAKYGKKIVAWDVTPGEEYFEELFRVSREQIIWGGNYFRLPPTRGFIVWDKCFAQTFTMAQAEYAWTSFDRNSKIVRIPPQGTAKKPRFHPTQKPVRLYDWIFANYAEPGMRILDTHMGSQSSRIAAWNAGLDFVGYEIDPVYFAQGEARFREETAQTRLEI